MVALLIINIIGVTCLLIGAFVLYRLNRILEWTFRIDFAILKYRFECLQKHDIPLVSYEDKEDVSRTASRFWNWNESQILPPDKYEIIKPYLDEETA